ncbi:MAG: DUF1330 domain-containing protein [Proteobacteria bacterium]|nr:DUF1330 domain-containing protein [Pseudomonadota bacterium]
MAESIKGYMIVSGTINPHMIGHFNYYEESCRSIIKRYGGLPTEQYTMTNDETGTEKTLAAFLAISEFPNKNSITQVLSDPDYVKLVPSRTKAFATLNIHIAEGFNPLNTQLTGKL